MRNFSHAFLFLALLAAAEALAGGPPCPLDIKGKELAGGTPNYNLEQFCSASLDSCEENHPFSLDPVRNFAKDAVVIYLPGLDNEDDPDSVPHGFRDTLKRLGAQFIQIRTDSAKSIESDLKKRMCGLVGATLANKQKQFGNKKVIIVGHSKGGATAILLNKYCPQVLKNVDAVVSIQGVVQGSRFAQNEIDKIKKSVPGGDLAVGLVANGFDGKGDGIRDFTASANLTRDVLAETNKGLVTNRNKTFCYTAEATPSEDELDPEKAKKRSADKKTRVSFSPNFIKSYKSIAGPNPKNPIKSDGMIAVSDQKSDACTWMGHVVGSDHTTLVGDDVENPNTLSCKQSFAVLFMNQMMERLSPGGQISPNPGSGLPTKATGGAN